MISLIETMPSRLQSAVQGLGIVGVAVLVGGGVGTVRVRVGVTVRVGVRVLVGWPVGVNALAVAAT